MAKGGSKTLTGVLCFIFGFLFAIIVEVASIAAAIYFLLNANIDDIFSLAGIENTDEDGNSIYINTNVDEGGVEKITDLISALSALSKKGADELTLGDFEKLFPIADAGVDKVYSSLASALSGYDITEEDLREIIDEDKLKETPFSELGSFFAECGNAVPVSTVLNIAGISRTDVLYLTAAYGAEAAVIYGADGDIVLYKDTFTLSGEKYVRSSDEAVLPEEYESYLVSRGNNVEYELYYALSVTAKSDAALIAQASDEGYSLTDVSYDIYSADVAEISGGYYYDASGELVVLNTRTVGDVLKSDSGIVSLFEDVYVTDIIGNADDEVLNSVLGGVTLGDLLNGKVSFDDKLDSVYVPSFVDVSPTDAIMMFVGYSLTDVQAAEGQAYDYTATRIIYEQDENGEWQKVGTEECYVVVESGIVDRVYYIEDGAEVEYKGVSISGIGTQTANITKALKVKDVVEIEEGDRLMEKLGEYYIADIGSAVDELYLSDFIDGVKVEDSLMAYIVYGISDIQAVSDGTLPQGVTHTAMYSSGTEKFEVYVVTEQQSSGEEVITRVYYIENDVEIECFTTVKGVNSRIDGVMDDLTLGELIEIDESNTILKALSGSTINSLSDDMNNLSVQELFADDIYKDAEMKKVVESSAAEGEVVYDSSYLYYYYDEEAEDYFLIDDGHLATLEEYNVAVIQYGTVYSRGATDGAWSLLIYGNYGEEGQDKGEKVYTVNNVASMQSNVLSNIGSCTLYEFEKMGVIEYTDTLDIVVEGVLVGDMTISQFLDAFGKLQQGSNS